MKRLFIGLVVANFAVYVIWFSMPYISGHLYDTETLDALSWSGHGATIPRIDFLPFAFLLAFGLTTIGLVFLRKWGRTGFLILTVFSLFYLLGSGLNVQTEFDSFLGYFVNLSDGAILTMAFLTRLSNEFEGAA
jgi:hypothetical protein